MGERVLIDGGGTNPLPFDLLRGKADVIVAVDITGRPRTARTCPALSRRSMRSFS
jgi:NTE family protein